MRQKPGTLRPSPTPETPGTSTFRPVTHDRPIDLDSRLSGRVRPDGSLTEPDTVARTPHGSDASPEPVITVSRITDEQRPAHRPATSPREPYLQNIDETLPHDADGLKEYKGRRFADIANDDGSPAGQTVMVAYHDLIKAYRARLPSERVPSGPPLYRVADTDLWSLNKPIEQYPPDRYTLHEWAKPHSAPVPNEQGYYAVHEWKELPYQGRVNTQLNVGFAFQGKYGRLIKADPNEARADPSLPLKLAHWTDGELWEMYNLRGAEILAFRIEAEVRGGPPGWARRRDIKDDHKFLLDSMKWSHPQKTRSECAELLRSYNLSVAQQKRLRADMETGFPAWAEQHKSLTRNVQDAKRFDRIAEELGPFSLKLRQEGENIEGDLPPVDQRYEADFLQGYLEHAGYMRNKHDYLYRTDIPAMFRADLRTPFELARDKRLVKLRGNPSDSTTRQAFSTTFSLANGIQYLDFDYYSNPRHYNSQANRYPGHFSDSDSSSGHRHSSGEESDTSFEMDNSRDYPLLRRKQTHGFLYVIDTRGIEVVPRVENLYLNNRDFDGDSHEGRISMPTRGISAERIWLVRSDFSRAARVEDIFRQAGGDARDIEVDTWAGGDHSNSYDQLIDDVARSGGTIVTLAKGKDTCSNDVIWPVAEHYRP
ncbi:hypothetical protein GXB78_19280 [Pseudomonas moraviensis subsp. stanleyae]|uniref:hypothetical protein n=1 Tax=Pseudomonas moraviensis TaxID=321662 RepID=UPI002E30CC9F|nr:hypothetical protein [Pseudomonas moraviensis]MED7669349.1 hypothetical protein [Pseudomonas moraviensis subsp. stanleyae]